MTEFIRSCLYTTMDSIAWSVEPRQLGEVERSTGVGEMAHFCLPYVGTAGPLDVGQAGVEANTPNYLLGCFRGHERQCFRGSLRLWALR